MATKKSPRQTKTKIAKSKTKSAKTSSATKTTKTTKPSAASRSRTVVNPFKRILSLDYEGLNRFNIIMAVLHAIQGVVVVLLSRDATLPVTTSYLTTDSLASAAAGQSVLAQATRTVFDINLGYVVAAFFFMSAIAHLVIATIYRRRYEADLQKGINKARWIEYGFSASTMMVGIALLSGIYELSNLIMIFTLVFVMNMTGLIMEVHNQTTRTTNWLSYVVGCIAGIVPWLVFAIYVWGATVYGQEGVPGFVYWIYLSIFIFFNCFAVNMYLQYTKKGRWSDYLFGERVYMVLSLVAKSALAWQVFAGTLRP